MKNNLNHNRNPLFKAVRNGLGAALVLSLAATPSALLAQEGDSEASDALWADALEALSRAEDPALGDAVGLLSLIKQPANYVCQASISSGGGASSTWKAFPNGSLQTS